MNPKLKLLAMASVMGFSLHVSAAPVTLVGSSVTYSFDDALLGLFGTTYHLAGDALSFFPTNFKASSANGAGIALTTSTINLKVTPNNPNQWLGQASLTEKGDYLMLDFVAPVGVMGVGVNGQLRVTNLGNPLQVMTDNINATGPLTTVGTPSSNWVATAMVDIASWQAKATNVAIENILYAYTTENVSSAFIEKKNVVLQVSAVPETETWAMLLAGLGLVGLQLRRRTKSTGRIALD